MADILRSMLLALREDIQPELQSAQSQHRLSLIDMLMSRIITELDAANTGLAAYAGNAGKIAPELLHHPPKATETEERQVLESAIAEVVAQEYRLRSACEQQLADFTIDKGATSSGQELTLARRVFSEILRKRLPGDKPVTLGKVEIVPGGRSKGTIMLQIDGDGALPDIVLRRDFTANLTGVPVTYEYPIIQALWREGVPVPEPLWLETDAGVIGSAYIAFARVPGRAMGTLFESGASAEFICNFAAVLARVHALNIDNTGLSGVLNFGSEKNPVRAMLDSFYQRYCERVQRIPLLDAAFTWLYLNLDSIGCERALVHGDAGLHNTMGQGDTLTGLLDWELAHAGDPAEDLCYCQPLIQTIVPWSKFIAAYQAAGGKDVPEARMRFFTIWRTVQLAIQMGGARAMYESGQDRDLRVAAIGFNSLPRILKNLAADLSALTTSPDVSATVTTDHK